MLHIKKNLDPPLAAENVPIIQTCKRPAPWHSKLIEEKIKNVINASKVNRQNPSDQNKESIKVAQEALDKEYIKEKEKYINNKIAELNNAHINSQTKLVWQTVNEVTGRKKSKVSRLKGKTTQDRLKQWKDHFENLLGQKPTIVIAPTERIIKENLPISTENFSMEELEKVTSKLKNNKARGIDDIPGEVWKCGVLNPQLLNMCNDVYNQKEINIWKKSCIIPLPKKETLA